MSDPLRPDLERRANRFRPVRFARVRRQPQSRVSRITKASRSPSAGPPHFIAADAERNRAIAHIIRGESRHFHHMLRAELPDGIQIPPDLHRPFFVRFPLRLANRPPHGIENRIRATAPRPPRASLPHK